MISPLAWLRRYRLKAAVRRLDAVRAAYIATPGWARPEYKQVRAVEAEAWDLGWRPEPEGFGRYQQTNVRKH